MYTSHPRTCQQVPCLLCSKRDCPDICGLHYNAKGYCEGCKQKTDRLPAAVKFVEQAKKLDKVPTLGGKPLDGCVFDE
jgi:hypothetical protein